MMISSLEKMESIVKNNRALSWDGWAVVHSFPSEKGRTSKFGAYRKGRWFIQKRIEPGKSGWNLPDNLVR
jgi:hypothetical protein